MLFASVPVFIVSLAIMIGVGWTRRTSDPNAKFHERFLANLQDSMAAKSEFNQKNKIYWDALYASAQAAGMSVQAIQAALAPYVCLKPKTAVKLRVTDPGTEPALNIRKRVDASVGAEPEVNSQRVRAGADQEPDWVGEIGQEPQLEAPKAARRRLE